MKPTVEIVPPEFRKWAGLRPAYEDQAQRAIQMAFTLINECLAGPDTPFGQLSRNGLLLNDETREYLYTNDYGFIDDKPLPGRSPMLERWIDKYVDAGMTDGQKVAALSQSLYHDVPMAYPKVPSFLYGESDEQTLLKGAGHCSCKARMLTAMCQMIGIQARPAMMWPWMDDSAEPVVARSGHTVAEAYIDGQWGFFDPEHHMYCQTGDGRFPSIADIRENPRLLIDMPADVAIAMQPVDYLDRPADQDFFQWYWYKNFNPRCMTQISRYDSAGDHTIKWTWATEEFRAMQRADYERYRKLLNELADRGQLTDRIYQMGLDEFLIHMGITDANLRSQARSAVRVA